LSRYGDLARLPRASVLLPEAGSLFSVWPEKSKAVSNIRCNTPWR
jgi:hypothetical protein